MKNNVVKILFLAILALAVAFVGKYISFNIPYVHVILFPFSNIWIASIIFFVVFLNTFFNYKYKAKKIFNVIFVLTIVAWLISIVFWILMYATGGI
jgi:hypothetical protein